MAIGAVMDRAGDRPGPGRERSDAGTLDARAIVASFTGPACLVAADGRMICANPQSRSLLAALGDDPGHTLGTVQTALPLQPLAVLVGQVARSGIPADSRVAVTSAQDPGAGSQALDVTLLPCAAEAGEPSHVLLVGKDTTLERNFVRALIASRELFRDLVACSADFAWETDASGHLLYVNGNGALGYSPDALNGRTAESLIDPVRSDRFAPGREVSPFSTLSSVDDVEMWLTSATGTPHCFLVSAVPVIDNRGERCGARGVCRDVTALRQREAELAQARSRELLSRTILDATLHEKNFVDMLSAAARAMGLSAQADRAWVLLAPPRSPEGDPSYDVGAAFGMMPHGTRHFLPPNLALPVLAAETSVTFTDGDWNYLGAPTFLRGVRNGGICLARHISGKPFDDDTLALVQLVAKHAAIAIAQASQLKQLKDLVNCDELTGLGNRRALVEAFETWKTSGPLGKDMGAALLYIDLDDFKRVNDTAGHGAGDALLTMVASLIKRDSRKRDWVIRLGGDEFVVWMDGMREQSLMARADRLLQAAHDIPLPAPLAPARLSLSLGAVFVRAKHNASLEAILAKADAALYAAKRVGKGRIVIAADESGEAGPGGARC